MLTFKIRTEYMKCIACPSPQKRSKESIDEGVKHNTKTADNINDTNNKTNSYIFFLSPLVGSKMEEFGIFIARDNTFDFNLLL